MLHWGQHTVYNDATRVLMLREACLPDGSFDEDMGCLMQFDYDFSGHGIALMLDSGDYFVHHTRRIVRAYRDYERKQVARSHLTVVK